ncbi:MAG: NAD(+) diphosphatase [bacterium]
MMQAFKKGTIYEHFVPAVDPPEQLEQPSLWFGFRNTRLLVENRAGSLHVPVTDHLERWGVRIMSQQFLGYYDHQPCFSAELEESDDAPGGLVYIGLHKAYGQLSEPHFALAGRALQIVEWDRTHEFCGRCGTRTEPIAHERAKKCARCGLTSYPRLAPAVIVLITRGDEILLSRSHHFPQGMYSVQAGFVEPGETLEEAVLREVEEETGLLVKNITYFGSQPWPFPNSLMIGFTAEVAGGRLKINRKELEDLGWYTIDNLPNLPGKVSIARRLIDSFISKHAGEK